eukprot:TRINITY_DN18201_c0_g1_i1.p1 TRINITY_DN18201_c0_g1~~TRINITY_DN18201_c0_g1_i1.p1  ORF type:complete len:677 (-),score=95.46 TRINITY_DN18201_c0_g1_i1:134-2107(-)
MGEEEVEQREEGRGSFRGSFRYPSLDMRKQKSIAAQSDVLNSRKPTLRSSVVNSRRQRGLDELEGAYYFANLLRRVYTSWPCDVAMGVLVLIHTVLIICQTDNRVATPVVGSAAWERPVDIAFACLYTSDVVLRIALQRDMFFRYGWNIFEMLVVMADLVMAILGDSSVAFFRLLRILKLLRLLRVVKLFKELHIMLFGFFAAFKALLWAILMLAVVLTVFSIAMVQLLESDLQELEAAGAYSDCEWCHGAMRSVLECNLTLIRIILAGDSWGTLAVPLIRRSPLTAGPLMIGSLLCINLGILNLILAVIVNAAQAAHDADVERKVQERIQSYESAKTDLLDICSQLDENGSGDLSLEELMAGFDNNNRFANTMTSLSLTRDDMEVVFNILDDDKSGEVSYKEFVDQLHKMKSQDTYTLLLFIKGYINEMRRQVGEQLSLTKGELLEKTSSMHDILLAGPHRFSANPQSLHLGSKCSASPVPDLDVDGNYWDQSSSDLRYSLAQASQGLTSELEKSTQLLLGQNADLCFQEMRQLSADVRQSLQELSVRLRPLEGPESPSHLKGGEGVDSCPAASSPSKPALFTDGSMLDGKDLQHGGVSAGSAGKQLPRTCPESSIVDNLHSEMGSSEMGRVIGWNSLQKPASAYLAEAQGNRVAV